MQGGVKAVDASNSTITLTTKTKDGGADEATYKLMKDAKIFLDNPLANKGDKQQEGSFKDLTENSHVHVQLTVDRKSILGVHVLGKSVHGTLKAHDSGNMTITISVKEDGQLVDKTYTLSKDARILDLNEGAGVNLRFSTTDKEKVVIAQGRKQN
jgi:Cu/Ag efflux protein CusF